MSILKNDWADILQDEFQKPYYLQLREFLKEEYATQTIYPDMNDIFNALHFTAFSDVKVVILGQDPYHGEGQAHGLSFSVKRGVRVPKSLINIYKELATDEGCSIPKTGYLQKWTDQGVLLLNTVLTVRAGQANSHRKKGWEQFTNQIIECLNERTTPIIFILWGRNAQEKKSLITNSHHYILESVHPSPLSASGGFFGSKPFSKTNAFLREIGSTTIDWQIESE